MNNSDIEHMEVYNISNVQNLKIGFINVFKLTKNTAHPDAEEDHFELVITSLEEKLIAKFKHSGAAWVIIVILLTCIVGIAITLYYMHIRRVKEQELRIVSRADPYSNSVVE
jgi:hypothetical protein